MEFLCSPAHPASITIVVLYGTNALIFSLQSFTPAVTAVTMRKPTRDHRSMPIQTVNPATGETVESFAALTDSELEERLTAAHDAFVQWRAQSVATRTTVLGRAAALLDERSEKYAALMTLEMGKTIRSAREEVAKCASALRFYATHATDFVGPERVSLGADGSAIVRYEPIGPVLAVMPWNFPFWQVVRFAAPALAAANVALLKHASNVPQCALALESLFADAGAPHGVFQTLLLESSRVAGVIADDRVAAVTLTGSEAAGREVGAAAGRALKKSVLELGGSDAFIVLADADIAHAARMAAQARTINNGQSCIAAKRFIVAGSVADRFEEAFVRAMTALRVGDPFAENTDVGPLATPVIRDEVHDQVQRTVAAGAQLRCGGIMPDGVGNYYPPTVLVEVPPGSAAAVEEVFGPVAAVLRGRDDAELLALANASRFGLGASVWTSDSRRADIFVERIEAGVVCVNRLVASDPRLPFGGVKSSGYGRELAAVGLREFVNIKTVRRAELESAPKAAGNVGAE